MAASSIGSWRYDVFPSFSGADVRRGFLSHLLMAFERRSINSFIDNKIVRSCSIGPALSSAIKEARIAVVIFSKNYADSTWCLNELLEIYKCYKELNQMVIPVFYDVDPSDVSKQKGEFGKFFEETCKGKTDDEINSWIQALTDVAKIAGEDLSKGPDEALMVEKIANDVLNKIITSSNVFGDSVGIEAQIEEMKSSILCLESEDARMIGIWGQSGIGKTTLGTALFSHLSPDYHFRIFTTYKYNDQLSWEQNFLSEILGQKDLKIEIPGKVERMLKHKKVLVVLDDVDNLEFLKTLVGKTQWFGAGSRIIVITQDKHLLEAHEIDLLYEVKIPDENIALKMLCRSAFALDSPPDNFKELAVEVAKIAGNLPLGLRVLGSSLKGRTNEDWMEMLPGLRNSLNRDIMNTLKVSYDRLEKSDKKIFLYIACLFNGKSVKFINNFFGDDKGGLTRLAEKSLIRITPRFGEMVVEMHNLLEKLGREIDTEESNNNPRFLTDAKDIEDVLTNHINHTDTKTLLGISFEALAVKSNISIDKKSFQGMSNLQFLKIHNQNRLCVPNDLAYLPRNLKYLEWNYCPLKCLPSNFKAVCLIELRMEDSKLEKLWEGTQQLGSLKTIIMSGSKYLKEIPDLSKAIKLERVEFSDCNKLESGLDYLPPNLKWLAWDNFSLKCLPSNFKTECLVELRMRKSKLEKLWEGTQKLGSLKTMIMSWSCYLKEIPDLSKAINLEILDFSHCNKLEGFPDLSKATSLKRVDFSCCHKLESFPSPLNSESLVYLNLLECPRLKNFPEIKVKGLPHRIEIEVEDCLWNKNLPGLDYLDCLRRCSPLIFLPEHLVSLSVKGNTLEKLWEGVQSLGSLQSVDLSESENLKDIPDLSKATNLRKLYLSNCKSLVRFPSTIRNLQKMERLKMEKCTGLEVLPFDIDLSSLKTLNLSGCSNLTTFPLLSHSIEELHLDHTAIEEIPCCIRMFGRLTKFSMWGCYKLKNISPNIFRLTNLKQVDFTDCGGVITVVAATINETIEKENSVDKDKYAHGYFKFQNCLKLDKDARELIMQSSLKCTIVLPGGKVPIYFKYRAYGNSLSVTLPQSSLCHQFLRFNVCLVVEPLVFSRVFLQFHFRGIFYKHVIDVDMSGMWETNHLYLFSFKFQPTGVLSKLDFKDVKFQFTGSAKIKEVGIRVLNVSPSPDDGNGKSFETEYNQQPGEICDVVETESSKKQMLMTSSEENFNLPCYQIVTERGEPSSVSSYPCVEGETLCSDSMITEHQDAQIPIVDPSPEPDIIWLLSRSISSATSERAPIFRTRGSRRALRSLISSASASIFSCLVELLEIIKELLEKVKELLDNICNVIVC